MQFSLQAITTLAVTLLLLPTALAANLEARQGATALTSTSSTSSASPSPSTTNSAALSSMSSASSASSASAASTSGPPVGSSGSGDIPGGTSAGDNGVSSGVRNDVQWVIGGLLVGGVVGVGLL